MTRFRIPALALVSLLCFVLVVTVDWDVETPLDTYVNAPDPYYSYYLLHIYDLPDLTVHVLNMTSQKWMDESFSDGAYWWHYLSIFIPKNTVGRIHDAAFIHIGGGNHNDSMPSMSDEWMMRTANFSINTKAVAAYLTTVPYQPITFPDEPRGKVEDFIIAYTWRMYIEDPGIPDPNIVLLLPMAKAAKNALDTMHDFVRQHDPIFNLQKFMPAGFSKRGWTTWLLGCVDQRVFAMAPTVFDLLNIQANLEHHYRGLGGWSWAFFPYWWENVSRYLYHPRIEEMETFMDPLEFNERLTMPKLIITAAGDQFFPPDGSHYFFQQLTSPKYMQIWENDDHSLDNHQDLRDLQVQAFFLNVYNDLPFPDLTWVLQENDVSGRISLIANPIPETIVAWWADTTNITCEPDYDIEGTCRRDFRIRTKEALSGIMWYQEPVYDLGNGQYLIAFDRSSFGYRGFFIETTYPGPPGYTMRFTTEVMIIPDNFPYPACQTEEECAGRLV